jgi:hypothetical protein
LIGIFRYRTLACRKMRRVKRIACSRILASTEEVVHVTVQGADARDMGREQTFCS